MAYLTLSTVMTIIGSNVPGLSSNLVGMSVGCTSASTRRISAIPSVGPTHTVIEVKHFPLVSWFPPLPTVRSPLRPSSLAASDIFSSSYPLTLLGNFVFSTANRFHLIPATHGDLESGLYNQVPGSARAEAERRRYIKFSWL